MRVRWKKVWYKTGDHNELDDTSSVAFFKFPNGLGCLAYSAPELRTSKRTKPLDIC
jgi:hypothetical protein